MLKTTSIAALFVVISSPAILAQDYQAPGDELEPGETATVPFLLPNGPEVPIAVTVTEIETGDIADLEGFELPAEYADATPYYARYEAENLGDEDLANYEISGFVGIGADGASITPSITLGGATPFETCLNPAPTAMAKGDTHSGCVLFLLPEGSDLSGVGYRGNYRYEEGVDTEEAFPIYYNPVVWSQSETATSSKSKGVVVAPAT